MVKRTRKTAGDRREEIVQKAIETFASTGFQDTSFQKIADALGLSQSAVLHHFRSKEALLEAALRHIVAHNQSLVERAKKPMDPAIVRLQKHFYGNADWAVKFRPEAQVILMLYAMAGHSPALATLYETVAVNGRARVVELVAAAIREGDFRDDLDAEGLGTLLHDMLVGGIIAVICLPKPETELRRTKKRWETAFGVFATNSRRER